ncbi:MAG TPA: AAA family ATPase [Candidatus Dormibacteraeota bacterium]|nr:AAA family ATPase [Candidatus Dormibacteraeota bacterium]
MFVGREAELAALDRLAGEAMAGWGRTVVIEGEAGIGKSRLVAEVVADLSRRGATVFSSVGEPLELHRPFGLIADCLQIDRNSPDTRRQAIARYLDADGLRKADEGGPDVRFKVSEAIVELVDDLTARGPVVMVMENLHWVDASSLYTLHRLGRRVTQLPLLLCCTTRSAPRSEQLAELLRSLHRQGGHSLLLSPLDEAQSLRLAAQLLSARVGPNLARQLQAAGGNPLYLEELVGVAGRVGALRVDPETGSVDILQAAPAVSIGLAVMHRLGVLTRRTVQVLRVASVLGARFAVTDLANVLSEPVAALVDVLDDAIAAGILVQQRERLAFRHDVVWESLYEDLPLATRTALHLQVGYQLAGAGAQARQVAEHLARGAAPGDAEAVEWLRRAARDALGQEPRVADRLMREALRIAGPESSIRDLLLAELADCIARHGKASERERLCREVLGRPHDPALEGRFVRHLTTALHRQRRVAEALAVLEEWDGSPNLGEIERVQLQGTTAFLAALLGDLGRASEIGEQAMRASIAIDDPSALAFAMMAVATVSYYSGRFALALQQFEEGVRARLRSSDPAVLELPPDVMSAPALIRLDRLDEALTTLREGAAEHERSGTVTWMPVNHLMAAAAHFWAARWDDAVAEIDASVALAEEFDLGIPVASCSLRAVIAVHRDQLDVAADWLGRADEGLRQAGRQMLFHWRLWARALLAEASGRLDEAVEEMWGLWELCSGLGLASEYPTMGPDLVPLALAAGQRERAAAVVTAMDAVAARNPQVPSIQGGALRCRGLLEDDADLLMRAVAAYGASSRTFEGAPALADAAAALAGRGRSGEARRLADRAAAIYTGVGAVRDAAGMDSQLRSAGLRRAGREPRRRPRVGWPSLTASERRVAALVACGRSNPQIAADLFISRRTVESHVSSALQKLGITSRVELAVMVAARSH